MKEREPDIEQHVWVKRWADTWVCQFCRSDRKTEPLESEIGLCRAAVNRMLVHDVGAEMQYLGLNDLYETQEVDPKLKKFTRYAMDLIADVGFAGEIIKTALGDKADPYKSSVLGEVFKEIRAERRRNQPIDGLVRLEQAVLVEIEPPDSD
jgi:hypothetical protein